MPLPFGRKFKIAYWSLAALGGLWALFLSSLTHPLLQRHALYAHKFHSAWWQDVSKPEKWGFLRHQVTPFNITTPDGERLYAWHVLPVGAYHKHQRRLIVEDDLYGDIESSEGFRILSNDPESRVVISFHGNAGHVGQGWRTDAYRALASGAPDKIHVIAIDYRGFGLSTGSPSELGLITDGIAIVDWTLDVAKIPPERIALVGQSLGTAVTSAVAEHFVSERSLEFAGIGLIAPFSDLVKLLSNYAIGGIVPILSPLAPYPKILQWFERKVIDTWHTTSRLTNLVHISKSVNIILIHAYNDFDIHWSHSETLFYAAAKATSEDSITEEQIDSAKERIDFGKQGSITTWNAGVDSLNKRIKYIFLKYGGHNRITSFPVVSNAVLDLLGL